MPIKAFADFVDFAEKLENYDVSIQLSIFFTLFDFICDKNGLDKTKTLEHMRETVIKVNKKFGTL